LLRMERIDIQHFVKKEHETVSQLSIRTASINHNQHHMLKVVEY